MYYWGVKYKKIYSVYSPQFEKKTEAYMWYRDYGLNLIKMFGRDLKLCEK
jgi:hypothetical protein